MSAFPFFGDGPDFELRHVSYRPQGASALVKDDGNNAIVARTGVGVHTITWSDKPKGYGGVMACVGNSLAHHVRPVGVGYVEATGVLTVTTFADGTTGAAAADIATGATNTIDLWVLFRGTKKI